MKFKELEDFVDVTLRKTMQHIYQPLLIRRLVEMGGKATIRQLAVAFLTEDESQLKFYEKKIKNMPLPVLKKRGIVSYEDGLVTLNAKVLTYEQKAQIKMLCEQRLQEYIKDKGLDIWDDLLNSDPVLGSLRERVLRESKGRCALCGITKEERPLEVDHIKPRSKGGTNDYENLQVLCSKCNREKSNKNDYDYRQFDTKETVKGCLFCKDKFRKQAFEHYDSVFAVYDKYPVTDDHLLVITKRHAKDYFDLSHKERWDADNLLEILKKKLSNEQSQITGFNVGMNCGKDAGQTIEHAHIHLIPRRQGDSSKVRGGIRGCVPEKMDYPNQ